MKTVFARVSSAHLIACVALFVALSTSVYAASTINGRVIKKGSIPGNRLRKDSVTGNQLNESSLGAVPRAVEATKAGEATKAVEATRAVEATKAGEATKATKALQADKATEATRAEQAGNAASLGGVPANMYQQACTFESVLAWAIVDENNGNPSLTNSLNCSLETVTVAQARDASGQPISGKYVVTFAGVATPIGIVVPTTGTATITNADHGSFEVTTRNESGGPTDRVRFSVVVF